MLDTLEQQSETKDLAVATDTVRASLPAIVADMVERAKAGDKTSLELLHRYYVQPMREEEVTERERTRNRSTPTLPTSVSSALTRFSAVLVKGETLAIPARPAQLSIAAPVAPVTIDASVAPPAAIGPPGGEAPANRGGGRARAWDPSPAPHQLGDRTNGDPLDDKGDEKGLKLCVTCGHPIVGRTTRAKTCLECAAANRQRSLAESARKQKERREQVKLQGEHDAKARR